MLAPRRQIIKQQYIFITQQIHQITLYLYLPMKSLSEFAADGEVFQEAAVLPEFFESNLVDPARVVKVFANDPQGHIRIFYYQYLKLCFELENINFDFYIRKIEEIINSSFHFIFYEDDNPEIFNDTQAKSLIMEFFGVLGEGGHGNVQNSLSHYPIMDYIFVNFFRSFLILMEKTDSLDSYIARDDLLGFLCPYFGVEVEMHNECIKYVDSDIFVYELNPNAIYMAYMDYERQIQSTSPPTASYQQEEVLPPTPAAVVYEQVQPTVLATGGKRTEVIKDSYIADQFMDYTSKAEPTYLTSKLKGTLKQSGTLEKETPQIPKTTNYSYEPSRFKQSNTVISEPVSYKPSEFSNYENLGIKTNYFAESKINQVVKPTPVSTQPIKENKFNQSPTTQAKQQYSYQANQINSSYSPQYNYSPSHQPQPQTQYNQYSPSPQLNQPPQYTSTNPPFQPPFNQFSPSIQTQYNQSSPSSQLQYNIYNQSPSPQIPQKSPYNPINDSPQSKTNQLSQSSLSKQSNQNITIQTNQVITTQATQKLSQRYQNGEVEAQPLIYNPKKDSYLGNSKTQASSDVRVSTSLVTGTTGKKKPFGLNISEQFTSPETMKAMAEPHRSNVQTMKNRARAFRSSLVNYIK